jgi:hypothetical protein
MMVTPLEAVELMSFLQRTGEATRELREKCEQTVSFYRLDHQVGNGRRSYLRRTYTCPFFHHKELGCPLPKEVKPFGCLAFNSHHPEEKAGQHCYSEKELLERRDAAHPEEIKLNQELREKLNLVWEKSPLPLALLDLWEKDLTFFDPESH